MAQQFAGAGLKIATDITGMLGPFVLIGERGDQQRVGPGSAESATGPMEKMSHRGGDTQLIQWSAGVDPALAGIRRAISSSLSRRSRPIELRWVENASSGGHTYATPAGHDLIVTLLRPAARGPPTYYCLSGHVNYKLRGCLNVLDAS
jgi:hypothetical protein